MPLSFSMVGVQSAEVFTVSPLICARFVFVISVYFSERCRPIRGLMMEALACKPGWAELVASWGARSWLERGVSCITTSWVLKIFLGGGGGGSRLYPPEKLGLAGDTTAPTRSLRLFSIYVYRWAGSVMAFTGGCSWKRTGRVSFWADNRNVYITKMRDGWVTVGGVAGRLRIGGGWWASGERATTDPSLRLPHCVGPQAAALGMTRRLVGDAVIGLRDRGKSNHRSLAPLTPLRGAPSCCARDDTRLWDDTAVGAMTGRLRLRKAFRRPEGW
jgi:hypothetical protein